VDKVKSDQLKRFLIAAVGGAALLHLLSIVGVELFFMSGVDPNQLDARVSSKDFWLMMTCIATLTISGVLLAAAYLDVLLLGDRFPRGRLYVAAGAAAIVLVWGSTHFFSMDDVPAFKSYIAGHVEALGAGALAAILMLVLSRASPRMSER